MGDNFGRVVHSVPPLSTINIGRVVHSVSPLSTINFGRVVHFVPPLSTINFGRVVHSVPPLSTINFRRVVHSVPPLSTIKECFKGKYSTCKTSAGIEFYKRNPFNFFLRLPSIFIRSPIKKNRLQFYM